VIYDVIAWIIQLGGEYIKQHKQRRTHDDHTSDANAVKTKTNNVDL